MPRYLPVSNQLIVPRGYRTQEFIPPYSPTQNANLSLWFDTKYLTGLNNGDPIVTVNNPETYGPAITAKTGTPLYSAAGFNGLPAMQFDGVNAAMQCAGLLDATYNHAFTFHVAVSTPSDAFQLIASNSGIQWYLGINPPAGVNGYADGLGGGTNVSITQIYQATIKQPHIFSYWYDGATVKVYYNRRLLASSNVVGNLGLSGALVLGDISTGGFPFGGFMSAGILRKEASSATVFDADIRYIADRYNLTQNKQVIGLGDSIMQCQGVPPPFTILEQLQTQLGGSSALTVTNLGQGGYTVQDIINALGTAPLDFYNRTDGLRYQVVVVLAGSNNLFAGDTAATVDGQIATLAGLIRPYCDAMILCTILPRTQVGTPAGFEAERQQSILDFTANYLGLNFAGLADIGNDPAMGTPTAPNDLTLYQDKTHPTALGDTYLKNVLYPIFIAV